MFHTSISTCESDCKIWKAILRHGLALIYLSQLNSIHQAIFESLESLRRETVVIKDWKFFKELSGEEFCQEWHRDSTNVREKGGTKWSL